MRKKSEPNKRRKKSDTNINCPTPQNPTEDLGASSPSTGRKKKKLRSSDTAGQSCSTEGPLQTEHLSPTTETLIDEQETPFSQSYLRARETGDIKSSIKKLADLDVISENELRSALFKVPIKHVKEHTILLDSYKMQYPKWHFQLRCNFGLLMYGFGSKKALLEDFASSTLVDGAAVVVNGYLPSVNTKSVVYMVAEALWMERNARKVSSKLEKPTSEHSIDELIAYLNDNREVNFYVYVIVHNIDGPSLRDDDAQRVLANLAACGHVRFVASVDHVNSSLLWDKRMSNTKFNWCWHNTPTYAPYTVESVHMPLILISVGSAKSAKGALLVLQSLTPNAQSVFRTLANYQLNHPEEQGLSVHKLYTLCRERFLVSSELTLRSHLTEFKDHELVRSRRGLDGQDCLFIPLLPDVLTKLLEQIGS